MDNKPPAILTVRSWDTPATHYPLKKVCSAKITRKDYKKNRIYPLEGVEGYDYYEVLKPIPVTSLQFGRDTAMVDDPLHWMGMQRIARHCKGNVITAGLGLG